MTLYLLEDLTVSFYEDRETFEVIETDEVNVIIEVLTYSDHAKFEGKIQKPDFSPDVGSKVKVRHKIKGIAVNSCQRQCCRPKSGRSLQRNKNKELARELCDGLSVVLSCPY